MTIITPTKTGTQWGERRIQARDGESESDAGERFLEEGAIVEPEEEQPEDGQGARNLFAGIQAILKWINNASNARAKEIRIQAVLYHIEHKNQVELAREIGVRKATICQQAVAFREYFGLVRTAGAASAMRSDESRKKFSDVCRLNHQKRKALSESTDSQRTLIANSPKPSNLRAKVLAAARLQ